LILKLEVDAPLKAGQGYQPLDRVSADIPFAAACFEWRLEAAPSNTEIRIGMSYTGTGLGLSWRASARILSRKT
jgi:hypothetical protein